jgi:hypothetical protein
VQPCLLDEGVWILHEPDRAAVIAHQDHALRQPLGVTTLAPPRRHFATQDSFPGVT